MIVWHVFYLMWPVYMANMAPLLMRKVNFLNYPVDLGKKIGGKRIFGSHKTYRGFFFGIIFAIITAYIQFRLLKIDFFMQSSLLDYSQWCLIGFLLGFGALLGDSIRSFFKRRAGVAPGKPFIPFDEIDYTIGSLLLLSFIYVATWQIWIVGLLLNFMIHATANHVAHYIGWTQAKW